jgi:hypothetical protein
MPSYETRRTKDSEAARARSKHGATQIAPPLPRYAVRSAHALRTRGLRLSFPVRAFESRLRRASEREANIKRAVARREVQAHDEAWRTGA